MAAFASLLGLQPQALELDLQPSDFGQQSLDIGDIGGLPRSPVAAKPLRLGDSPLVGAQDTCSVERSLM